MRSYGRFQQESNITADQWGRRFFYDLRGGIMDVLSTLLMADLAVRIAMLSLAGSLLLALFSLGRQARRRG